MSGESRIRCWCPLFERRENRRYTAPFSKPKTAILMMVVSKRNINADAPNTRNWRMKKTNERPKTFGTALMSLLMLTLHGIESAT